MDTTSAFVGLVGVGVLVLLSRVVRRVKMSLDRSPQEVADILEQFVVGERTGHLADDFIHIPISNPQLDGIRERFERLVDRQTTWEPQAPFPAEAVPDLQRLIEQAQALADSEHRADAVGPPGRVKS